MNRLQWIMRPAASIETPPVRNGHRAVIRLKCGHVIEWKLSRLKTYKPERFRCVECYELLEEFLSADACGALVERMTGENHDKQIRERAGRGPDTGGSTYLHGPGAEHIQRRFERGN